jgi:predicted nucleotide-binding protein
VAQKFYHVFVRRENNKYPEWTYEINLSKRQVLNSIVLPFKAKSEFTCNGILFRPSEIAVFRIYLTPNRVPESHQIQDSTIDNEVTKVKDITRRVLDESKGFEISHQISVNSKQVFIVHGHDSESKLELKRMIEKHFGLEAIILHEQSNKGNTIIESLNV